MEKIFLGQVKQDIKNAKDNNIKMIEGEKIYIEKHSWDCGWYWGFGYIGNKNLHTHFDNCLLSGNVWLHPEDIFESTFLTQNQYWELKDLMLQAYALRKCAEVYHYGGHCTTTDNTKIIQDKEKEKMLNDDLEKVLNKVWELLTAWSKLKK